MSDIVQKLWGFCHTLRHDGIDYGDYIEQITYLLFLKMADERGIVLPKECDWPARPAAIALRDNLLGARWRLGEQAGAHFPPVFAEDAVRLHTQTKARGSRKVSFCSGTLVSVASREPAMSCHNLGFPGPFAGGGDVLRDSCPRTECARPAH